MRLRVRYFYLTLELNLLSSEFKLNSIARFDKLEKRTETLENDLETLGVKHGDLAYSSRMQGEVLSNKADKGDIVKVERMFAHYAPYHEFKDLQKTILEDYTKNDEFEVAQKNISHLRDTVKTKADYKDTNREISHLKESIERQLTLYVKNSVFIDHESKVKSDQEALMQQLLLTSDDLKSIRSYSEIFNNKLKLKVEFPDLNKEIEKVKLHFPNF